MRPADCNSRTAEPAEPAEPAAGSRRAPDDLRPRRRRLLAALLVAGVAFAAAAPALDGELLDWDDARFVRDDPLIRHLDAGSLAAIFGGPHFEAYHPLHLLSYALDYQVFGLWAPGYRLHNLLLYGVCLVLLALLLRRLDLPPPAVLLGLLLFAAHPLHVEPVVWVSARKETLSLALMLGALLAHLASGSWRDARRWLAVALFGLALLAKTSVVVLPALAVAVEVLVQRRRLRAALARTAPLWLLAAGTGLYVVWLWRAHEMVRPAPAGGALGAAVLVLRTYGHHALKMLLPGGLSPVYPIDDTGRFDALALAGLAAVLGLGAVVWRSRHACVRLAAAWFVVALLPESNIVPVYFQVQDRYAFVPSVALALGGACLWARLAPGVRRAPGPRRAAALAAAALVVVTLTALSAAQARVWRSSLSLWRHAAATCPTSYFAHLGLGHALRRARELAGAAAEYRRAIAIRPGQSPARIALCLVDAARRAPEKAAGAALAARLERDLHRAWTEPAALVRLAAEWVAVGQAVCADLAEQRAFALQPPAGADLLAAASRWTLAGRGDVAMDRLRRARPLVPDGARGAAAYHELRAQALVLLGRPAKAARAMQRSLHLAPRDAGTLGAAADALERRGRPELARFYRETMR